MNFPSIFLSICLLAIPAISSLKAMRYEEESFITEQSDAGICTKERGDGRCNADSDCCDGRECNSFGFCQPL